MSLQYDVPEDAKDDLWIGTSSFLREDGINGRAVRQWQKAKHMRDPPPTDDYYYREGYSPYYAIHSDMSTDDDLGKLPFLQTNRSHRFMLSVPLRNSRGGAIGAFTVLDDKPRYGVSAREMAFAEEMADTIVRHLDSTLVRAARQRSERLIHALSLFNQDEFSLREWWLQAEDEGSHRGGRHHKHTPLGEEARRERGDEEFGIPAQDVVSQHHTERSNARRNKSVERKEGEGSLRSIDRSEAAKADNQRTAVGATQDSDGVSAVEGEGPSEDTEPGPRESAEEPSEGSKDQSEDLSVVLRRTHARASNLMREALDAEGVAIIDVASLSMKSGKNRQDGSGGSASEFTTSDSDTTDAENGSAICDVLGFSTRVMSSLSDSATGARYRLKRSRLSRLVRHYPRGRVFHISEEGSVYGSSSEEGLSTTGSDRNQDEKSRERRPSKQQRHGKYLGQIFTGARSLAFYPLWEVSELRRRLQHQPLTDVTLQNDRWHSCIIVWCNHPNRFFDEPEDLAYLAAFAHSVQAKTTQLETEAANQVKATFISTVSHELRSPLHGILAGIEFLQESELTSFQLEMSHTIMVAARTLLDTYVFRTENS